MQHHHWQRNSRSFWMTRAQRTTRGILEDKKGHLIMKIKIDQMDNIGMFQSCCRLCLLPKFLAIHVEDMQQFDGGLFGSYANMLPQIHTAKSGQASTRH